MELKITKKFPSQYLLSTFQKTATLPINSQPLCRSFAVGKYTTHICTMKHEITYLTRSSEQLSIVDFKDNKFHQQTLQTSSVETSLLLVCQINTC